MESGKSPGVRCVGESGSDTSGLLLGVKRVEKSSELVGDGGSSLRRGVSNI